MNIRLRNHPHGYAAERIIHAFGADASSLPRELLETSAKAATKLESCAALYDGLSQITGKQLPWGIFTGVRPIRFIRENRGALDGFGIRADKLALADEIIACQAPVISSPSRRFCLYIGIPFCPGRCKYCSFVSESVAKSRKLIPQYMNLLMQELRSIAEYANRRGLSLEAIYIGGGTPTSLPLERQTELYRCVNSVFDTSGVKEYTVEAGRPETLTDKVLRAVKNAGATRISINPQSMNDSVLRAVGRGHTVADVISAYERARKIGFSCVNMDIIAGLPGENENAELFIDSLNKVAALSPDNITVHSLSHKKGTERSGSPPADGLTEAAYGVLKQKGFTPYYLYRLSKSAGDNIGYARKGERICLYNIHMMEETSAAVLAAGCGGATRVAGESGEIRKHYNFKYPYEYISRFDEVIDKFTVENNGGL